MQNSKFKIIILILGIVLLISLTGNIWLIQKNKLSSLSGSISTSLVKPVLAEEIYPLFFCPCCGQPLDPNNICCGAAEEMIDYIDSLVANGISKEEVILKMAEKFDDPNIAIRNDMLISELLKLGVE